MNGYSYRMQLINDLPKPMRIDVDSGISDVGEAGVGDNCTNREEHWNPRSSCRLRGGEVDV